MDYRRWIGATGDDVLCVAGRCRVLGKVVKVCDFRHFLANRILRSPDLISDSQSGVDRKQDVAGMYELVGLLHSRTAEVVPARLLDAVDGREDSQQRSLGEGSFVVVSQTLTLGQASRDQET